MFGFSSSWELVGVVLQISLINVILSGDNAVVIALACRSLPPRQQKLALTLSAAGLVVLMTIVTACAAYLLTFPYLEVAGSLILFWIGVKLLLPDREANSVDESKHVIRAVKTIIIADLIMSIDNVLGMAGAAEGHLGMLVVGLVITIPLILFCSAIIMKSMKRFPILVPVGGALLGYVAGEMAVGDPSVRGWIVHHARYLNAVVPIAGAILVVSLGQVFGGRGVQDAEGHSGAE